MPRSRVTRILAPALAAGMLTAPLLLLPVSQATAQISLSVNITAAPPELPVYEQPPLPAPGYLWTPGFWSYGDDGYFWVPGTWVEPPQPGLLWTPGYWGWNSGRYLFNQGYWGSHVGFYGGINYGYGYTGNGFEGGEWRGREFAYNRAANNFGSVHVTNVYTRTIVNVTNVRRVSFNGPNGVNARADAQQEQWAHERHVEATAAQQQHRQAAAQNRELRAAVNHGNPPIKATERPATSASSAQRRALLPTARSPRTTATQHPARTLRSTRTPRLQDAKATPPTPWRRNPATNRQRAQRQRVRRHRIQRRHAVRRHARRHHARRHRVPRRRAHRHRIPKHRARKLRRVQRVPCAPWPHIRRRLRRRTLRVSRASRLTRKQDRVLLKKEPKTSCPFVPGLRTGPAQIPKSFLLLFFKKRSASFYRLGNG